MEFQAISGPKFTGLSSLNAGGIAIVCTVGRFWISSRSGDIRDQSEVVQNRTKFCMFLAPDFLGGVPP